MEVKSFSPLLVHVSIVCLSLMACKTCPPAEGADRANQTQSNLLVERSANDQLPDVAPLYSTEDLNDFLDITEFGADRTGRRSSVNAIRSALRTCGEGLCKLYFPEGTYIIDDFIELRGNTIIAGEDKEAQLKIADAKLRPSKLGNGIFFIQDQANILFEGLVFDVNAGANFTKCMRIYRSRSIAIRNCAFINSNSEYIDRRWTVMAVEVQGIDSMLIEGNYSKGCQFKLAGGDGSASNLFFINNTVTECPQMGISVVAKAERKPVRLENIYIQDNTFKNIDNHAIYLGFDKGGGHPNQQLVLERIYIEGNLIQELGFLGSKNASGCMIRFTSGNSTIVVSGNTIQNKVSTKFSRGLDIKAASTDTEYLNGLTITDNTISGMSVASIMADHTRDAIITGNKMNDGTRGIQVFNSEGTLLDNNEISEVDRGIEISQSTHLRIIKNTISNTRWGLLLDSDVPEDLVDGDIHMNSISSSDIAIYKRGPGKMEIHLANNVYADVKRVEQIQLSKKD